MELPDDCEHLIRECLGYKEEHVGTTQAEDHCLDSLRYAIYTHEQPSGTGTWSTVRRGNHWAVTPV